ITLHPEAPEYLQLEGAISRKVKGGTLDSFQFSFDGSKLNRKTDGYISDTLVLITDDPEAGVKKLPIVGSFKRVYSKEELANAPNIEFEYLSIDAGKIIQGDKMNHAFKFKNVGGSELLITGA